nr:MAG TPA: hypothetical protein [Caudoviricetes sp.]
MKGGFVCLIHGRAFLSAKCTTKELHMKRLRRSLV